MYGKIFGSLFDGSMRGQTNQILVFVNMLCRCNLDGTDDRHPRVIADEIGLPLETVREVLLTLGSPDPESRTPDKDGRRIELLDSHRNWGWKIINHAKYQSMRNEIDRREQNKRASAKHRHKNADASAGVSTVSHRQPPSAPVDVDVSEDVTTTCAGSCDPACNGELFPVHAKTPAIQDDIDVISTRYRNDETETEAEKKTETDFERFWSEYPRKTGKKAAAKAWRNAKDKPGIGKIIASVHRSISSEQWLKDRGQFIPHPATWLIQGRWDDVHLAPAPVKPAPAATYEEAVARMGL